jgi:hypothetical protein
VKLKGMSMLVLVSLLAMSCSTFKALSNLSWSPLDLSTISDPVQIRGISASFPYKSKNNEDVYLNFVSTQIEPIASIVQSRTGVTIDMEDFLVQFLQESNRIQTIDDPPGVLLLWRTYDDLKQLTTPSVVMNRFASGNIQLTIRKYDSKEKKHYAHVLDIGITELQ